MATTTTQWILELVDKLTAPMKEVLGSAEEAADGVKGVGDEADKSKDKLKEMSAIDLKAIADSVGDLANKFRELNAPGAEFNAKLKEVEAITGVTGKALDELGSKARKTAKDFGGDASAMMESYKAVLSRLGPDIANNQDALDSMGRSISTLSKTMGDDAVGSMDALTTAMLQFNIDISDPIRAADEMNRMMNVMAAGAKWGAAEVPSIAQALKVSGVAAEQANLSFEQTNAALQELAKGGKYGSEAGVALRNVLGKMAGIDVIPRAAAQRLQELGVNYDIVSDKSLPFTDRLRELSKAQGDATIMAQVFGVENAAAAQILMRSVDAQDTLTEAITGTNTATEQADIIMSGYNQRMARFQAWLTDIKIGLFSVTSAITPFIDGMAGAVTVLANMANARKGILLLFNTLKTMPVIGKVVAFGSALATGGLSAITMAAQSLTTVIYNIPIIGWVLALIAALVALGVYFYKTSATFRGVLMGTWNFVKVFFTGFYKFIWEVMKAILHVIKGVFNPKNWFDKNYKFADAFDQVVGAAKQYGSDLAGAFAEGKEKGLESYYRDHPEEDPEKKEQDKKLEQLKAQYGAAKDDSQRKNIIAMMEAVRKGSSEGLSAKKITPILNPTDLGGAGGGGGGATEKGLSGSGGGASIKHITQKIDMKNYFTVAAGSSKGEIDGIAEQVVRAINEKLRDGMVAVA